MTKGKTKKADFANTFKKETENIGIKLEGDKLRKLQKVELEILLDFAKICKEHNLIYTLGGGIALGAVRHKGFIPWDDDMDINVPINDIKKFAKIINANEKLRKKYSFQIPGFTDEYHYPFFRLSKKGTTMLEKMDYGISEIYIELFPIVNVYSNVFLRFVQSFFLTFSAAFLSCRKYYKYRALFNNLNIKTMRMRILIGRVLSVFPIKMYAKFMRYMQELCKDETSESISIPAGRKHFKGEMMKRSDVFPTQKIEFEKHEMNIANNFEKYLTMLYGDWQKIPEEKDREIHSYIKVEFGNS